MFTGLFLFQEGVPCVLLVKLGALLGSGWVVLFFLEHSQGLQIIMCVNL